MLTAIRQWVIRTMMKSKGQTGVVQTLPKRDLVELNTQITAQKLMQGGIDPQSLKNADQVENAIIAIESRPPVQQGIRSTKSAKVMDMEGKEIKDTKNIMGGKEINQQTLNEELMKTENPYSDLVNTPRPKTLKERKAEVLAGMEKKQGLSDKEFKSEKTSFRLNIGKNSREFNEDLAKRIINREIYTDLSDSQRKQFLDDLDFVLKNPRDGNAQGGRAGYMNGTLPMKKDGFFISPDFSKMTPEERELYKLRMERMKKGFEKKLSPEGLEKLKIQQQIREQQRKDRGLPEEIQLMAQGGRAGYKFGIGPLLKRLSQKSPKKAYTDYLESVKKRAQEGDMKSLAPELGAVTATGIFINRRMKDVLENMKEKDMENNLQNFRKELESDPFYQKYPDIKDKVLENYTEKMFGEKRADGGRIGFKDGMSRRTFLKLLGGMAAIPIVGKFLKPIKTAKGVKAVPIIKTDNVPGKPEWFDALVNKVITEGDDVSKKFATSERQSIHQKTLDDGSVVRVTEDVDDGAVRVEYDSVDNMYEDTVQLQYKKPLPDEGDPRPAAEFEVAESGPVGRQSGPDDFDIDVDEVGGTSISDLTSDVSKLKEYATGKKPTLKEFVESKKRKDKVKAITADSAAEAEEVVRRQGDYDPFASGGIARMLGE